MKAIKIINIFKAKENIPFMTCLITSMEENEKGINLTLENGENICIKDDGYYFLSETVMKMAMGWVDRFAVEGFHIPITMQIRYDMQDKVEAVTFLPTSDLRW